MAAKNQQVIQLLSTLRESNLIWIADEIDEAIDQGKSMLKRKSENQIQRGVNFKKMILRPFHSHQMRNYP